MIVGTPTGNIRFRRSFLGRQILQVEIKWHGMAAGSRRVGENISWRDAIDEDLKKPALRRLCRGKGHR